MTVFNYFSSIIDTRPFYHHNFYFFCYHLHNVSIPHFLKVTKEKSPKYTLEEKKNEKKELEKEENEKSSAQALIKYVSNGIGLKGLLGVFLISLVAQIFMNSCEIWLTVW